MELSQQVATYGLRATATPQGTNVKNDVQIGNGTTIVSLSSATQIYSLKGWVASGSTLTLEMATGIATFTNVDGVAQVETATAVGTITAAGNASVTVTSANVTGSPKTISVPVLNGDTAAQWADKVRIAIAADAAISTMFDVSGATTAIVLTAKPTATQELDGYSKDFYLANDATLNIALANGTCTGITTAATSTNTTAGVITSGGFVVDGDGKDFEGYSLASGNLLAFEIVASGTASFYETGTFNSSIKNGATVTINQDGVDDLTIEGPSDPADGGAVFTITVALS